MAGATEESMKESGEESEKSEQPASTRASRERRPWTRMAELLAIPGLVLGAAVLSCVTDGPNTGVCDDGRICPSNWICTTDSAQSPDAYTCIPADCGDGVVDRENGEVCDDGNQAPGDGCSWDCLKLESCGNMRMDVGEECDDGEETATCDADCTRPACGDGYLNLSLMDMPENDDGFHVEECDDGNDDNTDACTTECRHARCGDGYIRVGVETCDDKNGINTDDCPDGLGGTCETARCGDRFIHAGFETCDDGNRSNIDDCPDGVGGTCAPATCGDGFL